MAQILKQWKINLCERNEQALKIQQDIEDHNRMTTKKTKTKTGMTLNYTMEQKYLKLKTRYQLS